MKACTKGKRHKWVFKKNFQKITVFGGSTQISRRGIYVCECGETKVGPAWEGENHGTAS